MDNTSKYSNNLNWNKYVYGNKYFMQKNAYMLENQLKQIKMQ